MNVAIFFLFVLLLYCNKEGVHRMQYIYKPAIIVTFKLSMNKQSIIHFIYLNNKSVISPYWAQTMFNEKTKRNYPYTMLVYPSKIIYISYIYIYIYVRFISKGNNIFRAKVPKIRIYLSKLLSFFESTNKP